MCQKFRFCDTPHPTHPPTHTHTQHTHVRARETRVGRMCILQRCFCASNNIVTRIEMKMAKRMTVFIDEVSPSLMHIYLNLRNVGSTTRCHPCGMAPACRMHLMILDHRFDLQSSSRAPRTTKREIHFYSSIDLLILQGTNQSHNQCMCETFVGCAYYNVFFFPPC